MNGAFLHLAVNHIPVLGVPFAVLLLAAGLIWKSRDLALAGFVVLVGVGLLAYPVFKTGDMAMHVVHHLPGVTHTQIDAHEEAGEGGTWASVVLGLIALIGLWFTKKNSNIPKGWAAWALAGALGVSIWMGYVAHLGGLIRHPEVARNFVPPPSNGTDDDDAPATKAPPKPIY